MKRTWMSAFSLLSLFSTSPSSSASSKPCIFWRQMFMMSLLVIIAGSPYLVAPAHAVDNNNGVQHMDVQKRSNDDLPHRDVMAGNLNKPPEGRNSEKRDNTHLNAEKIGQNINDNNSNLKNPAGLRQDAAAFPDKGQDVPLVQPQQELQDQVKEKLPEVIKRNEVVEDRERNVALRQQMEERERAFNEHVKQQERLRNEQQNVLEAQKEQQREQQWLVEVHKKSQEALAERQQKQQQQLPQAVHGVNQVLDVHDRPEQVVNVDEGHAAFNLRPNLPRANNSDQVDNGMSNDNSSKQNDMNNLINNNRNDNNKAGANMVDTRSNNSFQQVPSAQSHFVLSGETVNIQNQVNQNRDVKLAAAEDKPQDSVNKANTSEFNKKVELPVAAGASSPPIQNRQMNNSNLNPLLGIPILVNVQNGNLNAGNQNGQSGTTFSNPPNVVGNNNQWAKYEFNNAQQPLNQNQQQQQQQPQIGGINLSWDWEDFSVMFNSYGAAEMKVRRSPHPTTGEPWPMPQYYSKKDDKIYKLSKELHFIPTGVKCDILEEGLTRHLQRTLRGCVEDMYDNLQNAEGSPIEDPALRYERDEFLKAPVITRVEVKVRKPCDKYPSLESDESYDLVVKKRKTYIWANEVWGALKGLETFGHLVWRGTDGFLYIKETVISDYPRFPHRGLHIDTSRHFLFKEVILDILDSMEMNKLNVFHWHIVDDQSFPYESKVYPELSRKGAFHPTYVYTLEDIAEIIEYARLRGIRVMPEFDTPGHTYSWGLSRPELLTQCYSGSIPVKGYLGPIDPSKNSTYRFLQTLFKEIVEVFKDQYLHLGGDEVPLGCWQSNPEVAAFAQELAKKPRESQQGQGHYVPNANYGGGWSMWSDDIRRVYEYYENRLISMLNEIGQKRKKGIKYVMWQEVMNNNLQLPNDTIIQVWMGDMADVMRATSMGYQVIYSTCWYMDHIEYGTKWPKYYNCDPVDQSFGFHIDEKKVLGGEAAFWAEYFSNENLIPLMWPRASAAAERLWSSKEVKNLDKAAERLSEHRCRMIKRGINAGEINGPGYCLHAPPRRRLYNDTAGCKGSNCSRTHNFVQIEDFEVHLSQRGGSLTDCGNVFTPGNGNVFIVLLLALVVVVALYALSKSSSHFHRMRICKNRSILIVFAGVLLVYILCYTTIWMRAFEFSGSFHKTLQEDSRSVSGRSNDDDNTNFRPISS